MWTGLRFPFIVKWIFSEFLPNLSLYLSLSLTIRVSIASCEKKNFQIKINRNIHRSIMIKNKLTNLHKLFLKHEYAKIILTKSLTNLQKVGSVGCVGFLVEGTSA